MGANSDASKDINKKWYNENALSFKNSIAIEHDFLIRKFTQKNSLLRLKSEVFFPM